MFDFRGLLTQILGRQRQYHEQQELGAGQESSEVIIHQPRRSSSQWQKENGELDEMHEYCCCHDLLVKYGIHTTRYGWYTLHWTSM